MNEPAAPASQLLILCAQGHSAAKVQERTARLVDQGLDWPRLLDTARPNRLLPLLYHRLKDLAGNPVPAPVLSQLKSVYYSNLMRHDRLAAELGEIVAALHESNVQPIVLKGGALAQTVYSQPALRPMVDLDLLVRPQELERSTAVLWAAGFRPTKPGAVPTQAAGAGIVGGVHWLRSCQDKTTNIDLQCSVPARDWYHYSRQVDLEALWRSAQPLSINGAPALTLSCEDMLIHLCLHLALYSFYACPLISYADIDRLIGRPYADFSWQYLVDRAARFCVTAVLHDGLLRTHTLLGTPVPDEVFQALDPGRVWANLLPILAPMDAATALQGMDRRAGRVRKLLLCAALLDQKSDVGGILRFVFFRDRERSAAHHSPEQRGRVGLNPLLRPFKVATALATGRHWRLVRHGPQGTNPTAVGEGLGPVMQRNEPRGAQAEANAAPQPKPTRSLVEPSSAAARSETQDGQP